MGGPEKRFWEKVKGNKNRGSAYKGYTKRPPYPTNSEMNQMDKHGLIYDIDPPVRETVIKLNRAGFRTDGSCAGHSCKTKGFIIIAGNIAELTPQKKEKLLEILKNSGLKSIRISNFDNGAAISVQFKSMDIHQWEDLTERGKAAVRQNLGITSKKEWDEYMRRH